MSVFNHSESSIGTSVDVNITSLYKSTLAAHSFGVYHNANWQMSLIGKALFFIFPEFYHNPPPPGSFSSYVYRFVFVFVVVFNESLSEKCYNW